jgi:hypothetical protein
MQKTMRAILVATGLAFTVWANPISATPWTIGAGGFATSSDVIPVHGNHHGCRWDRPVAGGPKVWHKHVNGMRVPC